MGVATPKFGEGWGYGVKNGPIRKRDIGFLLVPHSDKSAISNRFRRTQQRYRRTDGQNWYSNSRPDAARYALASVAKRLVWGGLSDSGHGSVKSIEIPIYRHGGRARSRPDPLPRRPLAFVGLTSLTAKEDTVSTARRKRINLLNEQ